MFTLVRSHAEIRGVSVSDLFRAAYMNAFGKDISVSSLKDDVDNFHKQAITPPYVIRYFLEKFNSISERSRSCGGGR